jgi:nucleotide-binding universal stress UspA family protein
MHKISSILVPIDFSDSSRDALEQAVFFAERFDARLEVLHVWEVPAYVRPDLVVWMEGSDEHRKPMAEVAEARAEQEMDAFLRKLPLEARRRITERLVGGNPVEVILRLTRDEPFDLVVMGTHGRTGLSHLLLGSVAERVVRGAGCPVLTVRAPRSGS